MFSNLTIVEHPLVQHKLTIMRERETVTAVFRQLLKEISNLLAYEITRELKTGTRLIKTPMTRMEAPTLSGKKLALISILRAGNGLLDGVLELIPSARVGFVGLYRNEETLEPGGVLFQGSDGSRRKAGDRLGSDAGDGQLLGRRDLQAQGSRRERHQVPLSARGAGRRPAHARRASGRPDRHSCA